MNKFNKICYFLCIGSIVLFAVTFIAMIWGFFPEEKDGVQFISTFLITFACSALAIGINNTVSKNK